MGAFLTHVQLESLTCTTCGGFYALSADYMYKRRCDGGSWRCPYCADLVSYQETQVQKLEKKLAVQITAHDQTRSSLRDLERQLRAQRGVATKLRKRIAAGTCPCCDESFADLEAHIKEHHPDYAESES